MKISRPILRAAVFAGLAVALSALGANLLAIFIASQLKVEVLGQLFASYLPATLLTLAFIFGAGILGLLKNRWVALAAGFVASLLASFIGIYLSIASMVAGASAAQVLDYLLKMSIIFVLAGTITTVTAGVGIMRRVAGTATSRSRRIALVRAPAPNLADGLVTHIKRKKVDMALADRQWDAYVETLSSCGWRTIEVEPSATLADSVFVEDTVVMLGNTAVITSPGAEAREQEIIATEKAVRELNLTVKRISKPGTLDGGDVLKIGTTIYVGSGGRTNGEGIRQFREIASALGFTVVAVPVTKVLHLKSAVTALPDGTVIGFPAHVDNTQVFPRFQPVPEPEGTAVVVLDNDLLLMSQAAPKTADLLRSLGYNVVTVDISEFEKLEGCVTCLSVRVR